MTKRLEALHLTLGAAVLAGLLVATPMVQPAAGALAADLPGEVVKRAGSAADCSGDEGGFVDRHGSHVPPGYEACDGIRPGALITAPQHCTVSFAFNSTSNDTLYLGTAGHCVSVDDRVSLDGEGPIGTVVWTVESSLTEDFALVEVDEEHRDQVDPTVCTWGGPTGLDEGDSSPGEDLYEYGWGLATFATEETRSRVHVENIQNGSLVSWNGVGSGGDSGAPILDSDGEALAVHVAGLTPLVGAASEIGVHIDHLLDLAADDGFHVELMEGGAFHPAT